MKKLLLLVGVAIMLLSFTTDTTSKEVIPSGLVNYSSVVIGNKDTTVLYFDQDCPISEHLAQMWEEGIFSSDGRPVKTYIMEHDTFKRLSWRSETIHVTK